MAIPLWRLLAGGLRSLVIEPPVGTGGTVSARYCYSVFMRHRVIAAQNGMVETPRSVVELGPGDSLGVGMMALLTGSENYIAIDAVRHASRESNIAIFDELVSLLKSRASIPFDYECTLIRPKLTHYGFPYDLFSDAKLAQALSPERLKKLKKLISTPEKEECIQYFAPFGEMGAINSESIDWIFSQAVLEHVDDLSGVYRHCFRCLRPGGIMTHQVDYQCHETAAEWNGHWRYPKWLWALIRGHRPWFVNRLPHSVHLQMQKRAGFELIAEDIHEDLTGITRDHLTYQFRFITDRDLITAGAFITMFKPKSALKLMDRGL